VLETFKLYSSTQCDSDACLIIRLLCKMESPSNHKLVADSYIATRYRSVYTSLLRMSRICSDVFKADIHSISTDSCCMAWSLYHASSHSLTLSFSLSLLLLFSILSSVDHNGCVCCCLVASDLWISFCIKIA